MPVVATDKTLLTLPANLGVVLACLAIGLCMWLVAFIMSKAVDDLKQHPTVQGWIVALSILGFLVIGFPWSRIIKCSFCGTAMVAAIGERTKLCKTCKVNHIITWKWG